MNIQLPDICYDCGKPLNTENRTKEHVPAQNLYEGFSDEFKENRITVPACFDCNSRFSKIDQEIRDLLAVKSDNIEEKVDLTGKGIRSILRRSSWKDRVYTNALGEAVSVSFDYNQLRELHIKNFKALFYREYRFPLPNDFKISIGTLGDEDKAQNIQEIHNYIRDGKEWQISGHQDIFKFILKDITIDLENGFYESMDFNKLVAVGGVLVYHDEIVAVIMAAKNEFVLGCKPSK